MVRPASRQMSTSRVASATSLAPQALKNSLPPPNVPVPKLRTGHLEARAAELSVFHLCLCYPYVRPTRASRGGSQLRTPRG